MFEIGVLEGMFFVVVFVDGGDEVVVEVVLFDCFDFEFVEIFGDYDESFVCDVFDVGEMELYVVDGDFFVLVRE